MADAQVTAVKQAATTPVQRLVVALTAVYAARPAAIRQLTLDDIDLAARRIRLHLSLQGVQLEQIRSDRVLHEALAVNADPLHLTTAFNLSAKTATDYADITRSILQRPIEAATPPFPQHPSANVSESSRRR